jgi:putative transcription factor
VPDYNAVVKKARERLGLTQEELGRRVGEKASVISKIETGRLRPSVMLARKLEHVLRIKLLESIEEVESSL